MKNLFIICLLVFLCEMCNAQKRDRPEYNELDPDQLKIAFTQASTTVKTGKILTFAGAGAFAGGVILFSSGINDALGSDSNTDFKVWGGAVLVLGGFVSTVTGVPVWIVGSGKKKKIELELVKYNPAGFLRINGIGINVRF